MIVSRIFNCAAPLALLSILGYGAVAAAEDPLSINWSDMLLSYRNNGGGGGGRRYLQSSSSSCSSDAFNTCMSNALPSSSAIDSCVSCMNAANANAVLTETDCASASDYFCAAVTECSCAAPCRVQYASLIQCVVVEGLAEQGETFPCTINCGSNSGGSTSDGGSTTSSGSGSGIGSGSPSTSAGSSMTKGPALALAAAASALGFSVY